ncbi:MAG: hypothetical protein L3J23_02020 [Flavobacteriaceae bacterium]|nr:hypothetical protein [Flavobacteriaceae bacterium]
MKKIVALLLLSVLITSCKTDDDSEKISPKFKFTFNWDGEAINASDFNAIKYSNETGELSITKMRYLLSNITLIANDDVETKLITYHLIDLTEEASLSTISESTVEEGNYKSLTFTVGFNEAENTPNAYTDLNITNWNWPIGLGDGYHIMQYEGKFLDASNQEQTYSLHVGTRKISDGVFEPNHFIISFDTNLVLNSNSEIEIKMNIAEWFKNPNLLDLNTMVFPIMPNPVAQLIMRDNGASVFSVGIN